MKKRIALLLAAAMTISMLAGCGSKEEPAADTPASTEEDAEAPAEGGDAEAEAEAPAGDGVAANTTGKVAFVTWQSDAWHHQTALITQQALEEDIPVTFWIPRATTQKFWLVLRTVCPQETTPW